MKPKAERPPTLPSACRARYRGLRLLGKGGFGQVILAQDQELDRLVAIKVLGDKLHDPEIRARFEREAILTGRFDHAHVVRLFDHGLAGDGPAFIVYEYVEGRDLDQVMSEEATTSGDELLRWGAEIADALAAAHELEVLHRDVKPGNVMIRSADRHSLLCDFGISYGAGIDDLRTSTGVLMGTPAYMANELWVGQPYSPASDQYAWAATLFEVAYRQFVYPTRKAAELIDHIRRRQPIVIPPEHQGRHPDLEPILLRALSLSPRDRYGSMAEMGAALEAARQGGGPGASDTQEAPPEVTLMTSAETVRLEAPPSSRRWLAGAAVGAGCLLLTGLVATRQPVLAPPTPSPSPAPPSPSPAGAPPLAALPVVHLLEESAAVLAPGLPREDDIFRVSWQPYEVPRQRPPGEAHLYTPAFLEAWEIFLERLLGFLDQAQERGALETPEAQALLERVGLDLAIRACVDHRQTLNCYQNTNPLDATTSELRDRGLQLHGDYGLEQVKRFEATLGDLLRNLEAVLTRPLPPRLLALVASLRALSGVALRTTEFDAVHAALLQEREPAALRWLARAELHLLATEPQQAFLTGATRGERITESLSRLAVASRWAGDLAEVRARLLAGYLAEAYRAIAIREGETPPATATAALARAADLLEPLLDRPAERRAVAAGVDKCRRIRSVTAPGFYRRHDARVDRATPGLERLRDLLRKRRRPR